MNNKRVLFICTGNSARSQMAEGFLRHMAGGRFEVFSAGVKPIAVNPLAIKVMAEIDIDISKHTSKSVMGFIDQNFDYVITVCGNAQKACPVFPGEHEKIHWDLEDPAAAEGSEEEKLDIFRKIRNEIKKNTLNFLNKRIDF
ncbi:MAG: protein-tyrosine-phosphatase [Candidatus Omnitrophica bacterium CG_4_9_14_0_2_um_filter_42_8]|nr:MAG: protein-tyrosine-phosphatase [Candidatus Omnitrophica bacterium CG_4_9_14_0_2_um_filter_42_8]